MGPVFGNIWNYVDADTLRIALVNSSTLRAGAGNGTTLGTDVVGRDTHGAKSHGISREVVMSDEEGSGSTSGGIAISRIAFDVSSPNVREGAGGLGSFRSAMMSPMDWRR